MANKKFLLGMLAAALAFGMMAAGCNRSPAGAAPNALNGTWVSAEGGEMTLNNGVVEMTMDGSLFAKGTYTATGDDLAFTHIHGDIFEGMVESKLYTWTS